MKQKILLGLLLLSINVYGFEVNTHQALTRCATTTECGREGSKNLDRFELAPIAPAWECL